MGMSTSIPGTEVGDGLECVRVCVRERMECVMCACVYENDVCVAEKECVCKCMGGNDGVCVHM